VFAITITHNSEGLSNNGKKPNQDQDYINQGGQDQGYNNQGGQDQSYNNQGGQDQSYNNQCGQVQGNGKRADKRQSDDHVVTVSLPFN
jgi:hypothetical protein